MNGINKQPLYVKGDYALIAKYNRFDDCVQIADINTPFADFVNECLEVFADVCDVIETLFLFYAVD